MRLSAVCLAVLFAASTTVASALLRVQETPPAAAEAIHPLRGPDLFVASGCSHCHTIDGKGGVKGPNLSGIGRRWKDDAIRKRIEEGALEMPAFKDVLTDTQVQTLVTYLHTRRAREPKVHAAPLPTSASPAPDPS